MISTRTLRGERKRERERERETLHWLSMSSNTETTYLARKGLNLLSSDLGPKQLDLLKLSLRLAPKHLDGAGCGRGIATDNSKRGHTPGWIPRVNDIGDVLNDILTEHPLPMIQNGVVSDTYDVEL